MMDSNECNSPETRFRMTCDHATHMCGKHFFLEN